MRVCGDYRLHLTQNLSVGELPTITGRIMNACAQDENQGIDGDGVFSSFSAGGSGRPSNSTYDAKADSVELNFGSNMMHNNTSPCVAAYLWKRTA